LSAPLRRSVLPILAAIPLLAAFAGTASAQQGGQAQRFEDWQLVCPDQRTPQGSGCFITQRQVASDTGLDLLGAAIYFEPGKQEATIQLRVPPQVDREQPLMFQVDKNPRLLIDVERCNENFCATTGTVNADLLKQFRSGTQALVGFEVADNDQDVAVPLSLKGFSAAYQALEQQGR
jgi:invasion protein IalB